MLDLPANITVTYVPVDKNAELLNKRKSLSSENENIQKEPFHLERSESLHSFSSSESIKSQSLNINGKLQRRSRSKPNLLRSMFEKNGENAEFLSASNIRNRQSAVSRMKHSLSSLNFLSPERNSREFIGSNSSSSSIRSIRKTLTNPHLYETNSTDSLLSDYSYCKSVDSLCSSAISLNESQFSICDSCDSICESVVDLLEKKETKKYTEMEDGHLKLITYNQCPKWLADNPYIITKYRPPNYSYISCYKSLFYLHNETGNIYTHLVGSIFFTVFYIGTAFQYIPRLHIINSLEMVSIIMPIVGGFVCMCFSWHFHLFSAHSLKVNRNWLTCDFVGIVSLIYTTGLPLAYYSFYCYPEFRVKYMAVAAIIGAVSLISMFNPIFSRDEYRLIRSGLFVLLAASELIPNAYGLLFYNKNILFNYLSIAWVGAGVLFYLIGVVLYAKRIPEIYYPGNFDIIGHSHQIFHTLILFASISFYIGIMKTVKAFHNDLDVCTKLY